MIEAVKRPQVSHATNCIAEQYTEMYRQSVEDPTAFWLSQSSRLDWVKSPTKGGEWSYDPVDIRWFSDGALNLCYNAVDRHVEAGRGDVTALIFEPDDPASEGRSLTYGELQREVVAMANALKAIG
ncbi:MAG: acetyl-coenzyme A synthetase N-terminal domain-containing protein, partial [Pseudomonadota bacterium]